MLPFVFMTAYFQMNDEDVIPDVNEGANDDRVVAYGNGLCTLFVLTNNYESVVM